MEKEKTLEIGVKAPQFELDDQNEEKFKLSEFRGKNVLLSFHPLAWTTPCAKHMKSLEENKEKFDELNTIAVGISVDSVPCKSAWAEELGITETRLLSDFWPHGMVAEFYDVFDKDEGFSQRANVIVNKESKIIFFKIYDTPKVPDINEVIEFLEESQ